MSVRLRIEGASPAADLLRGYLAQTPDGSRGKFVEVDRWAHYTIALHTGPRLCLDSVDSDFERRVEANLEELHDGRYEKQRAGSNRDPKTMSITAPDDCAEKVARSVYRAVLQLTGHGRKRKWYALFALLLAASSVAADAQLGPGPTPIRRVAFASLGTPADGTLVYCIDCAAASSPCTGSGTGSFALRQGGAWVCPDGGGGGGGAPTTATYLVQTANGSLPNAQAMGALATGIVKNTTTTGVQSIAVAGDFPTLNQSTTGNAATSTALAANPSDCASDRYATTIAATGDLTCAQVSLSAGVTGTLPEANGGTNQTTYAQGDLLYASGSNTLSKLAKGSAYQVLRMNSGATGPEWAVPRYMTKHEAGTATGLAPADGTTYYFGQFTLFNPSTSSASQRMFLAQATRITDVRWTTIVQGAGSAEDVSLYIRKNDTTDTLLGTQDWNVTVGTTFNSLAIDFAAGDDFVLKFTGPTWATNPTGIIIAVMVWWQPL